MQEIIEIENLIDTKLPKGSHNPSNANYDPSLISEIDSAVLELLKQKYAENPLIFLLANPSPGTKIRIARPNITPYFCSERP